MPLSKIDKEHAETLANRLYICINAMDEGNLRLHRFNLSEDKRLELYNQVMFSPDAPGSIEQIPELADLDTYIHDMERKIAYHSERDTTEDAMWMLAYGNAGSLLMDNHLTFNHPRIKLVVIRKMTKLHSDNLQLKREQADQTREESPAEDLQNVAADEAAKESDEDLLEAFRPSVIARESQRAIEIEDFRTLPLQDLFSHIFYVDYPDYAETPEEHAVFEILGRKETREGSFYQVRWEGLNESIDISFEELAWFAKHGLWMSPT